MKKHLHDPGLDALLALDGERFALDSGGTCWVKFDVKSCAATPERPKGLRYSLTLHDRSGARLLGFDNAHAVQEGSGPGTRTRIEHDHQHRGHQVRFYLYETAAQLLAISGPQSKPFSRRGVASMSRASILKVGIASLEQYKARTMAIARGEYVPSPDEPKVWFQSLETLAQVLSDKNRSLLTLMAETEPASLSELAERSGRAKSNLSRTLRTMERYGLVRFEKGEGRELAPRVNYSGVALEMSFA
jgi:predicted transcriptional regulator